MIHVRDAVIGDVAMITQIQNAGIATTTSEYREEPHPLGEREEWFAAQVAARLPVLVAVDDGAVVGFATYGSFRNNEKWPGFRYTVEHTVHVAEAGWGAGVGRRLMDELIARAFAAGVHVMIGAVDGSNVGSIRFHERIGFVEQGRLDQVGWKNGRWLDLVFMARTLTA